MKQIFYISSYLTLIFCLFGSPVFANSLQANVYGGATFSTIKPGLLRLLGETDSIHPKSHPSNGIWGLGVAYRYMSYEQALMNTMHDLTIGLNLYHFSTTHHGTTRAFQHPHYEYLTFQMPIQSTSLMIDSEFTFNPVLSNLLPFIQVGIGGANNKISYQDIPNPDSDLVGLTINSHSAIKFAYSLGAGVKLPINTHLFFSIRYLYSHLGHAQTAMSANLPLTAPVSTSIATQSALFGLSYVS